MKSRLDHFSTLNKPIFFLNMVLGSLILTATAIQAIPLTKKNNLVELQSNKGQVVESGSYHLELVTAKENNGIHLDLFVQKGDNHQPISNAKVTGQVQLPSGQIKNLNFTYDTKGKHYMTLLTEKNPGQYQLKVTVKIGNQQVNGRFSFKQ
jgi:hypothetical protein